MGEQKRAIGRPRGQGPLGALRARLSGMDVGASTLVGIADLTVRGTLNPGRVVSTCATNAAKDLPGAKFSVLSLPDGVLVRRLA